MGAVFTPQCVEYRDKSRPTRPSVYAVCSLPLDAIALEGLGIDRRAQAGRILEVQHTVSEPDRIRDDVTGHLQGADGFAPRDDRVARGGQGSLGERREREAEAVADHDAQAGSRRAV